MTRDELLVDFESRAGMYIDPVRFETVVAFVNGYNLATDNTLLFGFREWLQVKLGRRSALVWSHLILEHEGLLERSGNADQALQDQMTQAVFSNLRAFLKTRASADDFAAVFLRYSELSSKTHKTSRRR